MTDVKDLYRYPDDVDAYGFDWGQLSVTLGPQVNGAARFSADGSRSAPARISVEHNGVLIHDDVALEGPTGKGEPEAPKPGPLYLQDHGSPVFYRNIWIIED